MFDIGFAEIILFFVVALLVVGPERLPRLARTAGLWIGKARRVVSEVKSEVERELQVEEIKDSINRQESMHEMKELAERVKSINTDLQSGFSESKAASSQANAAAKAQPPPPSNAPSSNPAAK